MGRPTPYYVRHGQKSDGGSGRRHNDTMSPFFKVFRGEKRCVASLFVGGF